jgi:hypothetical protein
MNRFEQFNMPQENVETPIEEKVPESMVDEVLKNNPELAEIYGKRSGAAKTTVNESGKLVSEGHEYEDNAKMRSLFELANAIREQLPAVQDGHTRLWRGNRPDEVGHNPSYTNSLEGIALPFLRGYGGMLSYIDVPTAEVKKYMSTGAVAPDSEFILPNEMVKIAKIVGVTPEREEEIKRSAKPLSQPQGNGWESV